MTVAVCLKCGEFKHGAFTRCGACGYEPADDDSLTRHLLITDHYLDQAALEAVSERVKAGQPITFDAETLAAHRVDAAALTRANTRLAWTCGGCLAVVIAVAVANVVWRLSR